MAVAKTPLSLLASVKPAVMPGSRSPDEVAPHATAFIYGGQKK
jgi:hypothetical protein